MTEYVCIRSHELKEEGITAYRNLFHTVFGQVKDENLFHRQFLSGPIQSGYHAVMRVNDEWVGCYSAIPMEFHQSGQLIKCALVVDAIVHPQYQGKGHLRKILNVLYERMYLDGFSFLYGMPNPRFKPLLTGALGWQDMGRMEWYIANSLITKQGNPISNATIFRKPTPRFTQYRYSGHKQITLEGGSAWVHCRFPAILTGLETENPESISDCFHQFSRMTFQPILFPYIGPSSPGSIKVPKWLQGSRTMIAAFPLHQDIPASDEILLRLSEFDLY
jgi:hypothetical protein